jgi:4-diphosphocytidyl-2C-methyl-D-erythritol kinase
MTTVGGTTSEPPKLQRYLVLSATRTEIEQELNKLAEKGYKPILMSGTGGTINLILERSDR